MQTCLPQGLGVAYATPLVSPTRAGFVMGGAMHTLTHRRVDPLRWCSSMLTDLRAGPPTADGVLMGGVASAPSGLCACGFHDA